MADGVLEMEVLLAPLGEGEGAGEDTRTDYSPKAPYQLLRNARGEARALERRLDGGDPEADPATILGHWREVKKLGISIIGTKSKDFEIASWLTEALVRLDGLAGLQAGSQLIAGLAQNFWDKAFPSLEEPEGIEDRASPIGGLAGEGTDGTLMQPLRRLTLFRRGDGSPCDLFLYKRAEETAAIVEEERRERRYKEGVPQLDVLQREGRADGAFLRAVALEALAAREAWQAMDQALTDPFAGNAPSTRNVNEALGAVIDLATRIIGPLQSDAPAADGEAGDAGGEGDAVAAGGMAMAGGGGGPRPMRTREDAIKQIEEIAAYFRKTEPHSPVAFTLEDAARRARMPLTELLVEVLPEGEVRRAMLTRLGIHQPEG
ncbi:type VI secretion system protein TssA [Plastoroseomonas hellenica]|uniref:type VI secretion system protein TssA n=1 Tax=Plastoroseomonas hellenica TaxID=2687306 RepID=UPI001BAAEAA7|nr:type VI secretion system protein TssA [Plastoroseomonas hellenica]MBR0645944.1 type VI secretion system protein TssA [Plastoroseomonas hellenica]